MLKLFVEDYKNGYMDVYTNVYQVKIAKHNNKNCLEVHYRLNPLKDTDIIPLSEIKLCWLINADTLEEYFRYEK